jgi:hypothetical protein
VNNIHAHVVFKITTHQNPPGLQVLSILPACRQQRLQLAPTQTAPTAPLLSACQALPLPLLRLLLLLLQQQAQAE